MPINLEGSIISHRMYCLLSSKNFRFQGKGLKKLFLKYLGPFNVIDMVGKNACRLDLPDSWAMHNVVHVNLLRPYKGSPPSVIPDTKVPIFDNIPQYQVKTLLAHRIAHQGSKRISEFLAEWKHLSP